MKIYIIGNPLVKIDSLPLLLLPALRDVFPKIDFITADPNENFPPKGEKSLIIIDTVLGISKVDLISIDSLESINKTPISPHDYDLLFHLQLLIKLKKIESVKIIGIPQKKYGSLFNDIRLIIKKIIVT